MFDLYAKGVHGGVAAYQQGNPLLEQEYSFNKDVGIRYFTQRVNVSFIVFHNAIDDYIYQARTAELHAPSGLPIHQLKQGDAKLWGSEIEAQWQFTDSLKLKANYTKINSKLSDIGTELPLLPADKVHAELLWQPETLLIFQAAELYLNTQYYAKNKVPVFTNLFHNTIGYRSALHLLKPMHFGMSSYSVSRTFTFQDIFN